MSKSIVLNVEQFNAHSIKYMAPKLNPSGGKSISIISTQTNRSLCLVTPSMMTWGISDYENKEGVRDGKFNISLCFPMDGRNTSATDTFLEKIKAFEEKVLNDVVTNSKLWIGQPMKRDIAEFNMSSCLKYSKSKETGETDYTKPPSIRAKVPKYDNKWNVEIYDPQNNLIFPTEDNGHLEPSEYVPSLSSVVCIIQCAGIWVVNGKWGITWKLVQCVVKPKEVVSILGNKTCLIELSAEDRAVIERQQIDENADPIHDEDGIALISSKVISPAPVLAVPSAPSVPSVTDTHVEDSDTEDTPPPVPAPVVVAAPTVPAAAPAAEAPKKVVKKVVKKTTA
jgi:hypothetical protein